MALRNILLRFLLVFAIPNVLIFLPLAYFTTGDTLVAVFNIALVSAGLGVCTAYLPAFIRIMFFDPIAGKRMTGGDLLSMGVFSGWFAVTITRLFSLAFFYYGRPSTMLSSDLFSYCLFMSLCSAFFHLRAPAAVEGHVPSKTFVYVGIGVSIASFVLIGYAYVVGIVAI